MYSKFKAEYQDYYEKFEKYERDFCLGCDKTFPAYNCKDIKKNNKNKKSGFYWVQSECSDPSFVFCDFDFGNGNYYIYEIAKNLNM